MNWNHDLISKYNIDGIRIDAVSNIIFYDGNKNNGTNEGAVEFIKRLNGKIHYAHPEVMMIAEDSTDFPNVTVCSLLQCEKAVVLMVVTWSGMTIEVRLSHP